MKQLKKHIWLILIALLLPAVYGCNGNTTSANKADTAAAAKPANDSASPVAADTVNNEQQFRLFFAKFKAAVKANNKAQLTQMFSFPLQTLPQWTNDELKSAPVDANSGLISQSEFTGYYNDIFTKDAVRLIPASTEDDLSEIDKTTAENYYITLKHVTDKGSILYELEKQYTEDNGKETSFGFVFGKVKGAYKVISYYRPWPLK
ncbi:hypothetical protein [Mucilaginibacter phyllosphaerae]|uniref:Lipoprotein n=1 Tax=Mucilaginibacter phyllosphaerae TaxID=1812349 RepID=A0A4Y8AII8_9SPHI|nr:hypothetical protein [Mucilaginibacter phyllosphaerae]MBB3968090.1 hypothetical protein [Mucilaginibacter phyllosphaerae]TEW68887.1 hypothetical protein E2R65_01625 [Mucilaginibacter phyllosphaerae]GGH01306.1 hypothetical protein GCM10007352_02990 [Mucilaginibacter phyllosphaerae]